MSAQRSANSKCVDGLWWGLRVGLLGLLMAGCQTASPRFAADRPAPTPGEGSGVLIYVLGEPNESDVDRKRPLRKSSTAIPRPKQKSEHLTPARTNGASRVTFTLVNWQSEEPPPLLTGESNQSSDVPIAETFPEVSYDEICFGCDLHNAFPTLWRDTKAVVNWNNALILTAAGGLAIGFRQSDIDQRVRDEVAEHPQRWGNGTRILGNIGDVAYQAPVMLGVYGYSVWKQDDNLHDMMGAMLSASVITGVSTSALKLIANTDRPSDKWNNGHYGFPSYHTASTFAIAAVLDEYYGSQVGLPAYALATAVGFSRLDDQDHDLSDVVFGGVLGFVIGKTVAGRHLCDDSNLQLSPYVHPTDGTPGIAFEAKF